jgi:CheY-like chemotaxis protein
MNASVDGLRVLVVEDEAMIAMLIEDMLLGMGCTMLGPAADTARALSIIEDHQFDVAVLDVNLGGERTTSIAASLRAKNVPFVFATGYGTSGIDEEFRDKPILTKPFRDADLQRALDSVISTT